MEWESWLEKEDKEIKKKPTMFPRIRREFDDEKDEEPMVYNKNAAWEDWLEKDALNPDSKDKPSLMNTQRFARISTEVRGGGTQGGKLGDASQRGLKQEEKPKNQSKKRRKGRIGVESSTETPRNKKLYHGTERQAGHFPALGTDSGSESGKKFTKLFQNRKAWEAWLEKDAMDGKQGGSPKDEEPKRDYLKEFHDEIKRIKAAGKNDPKRLAYLKDREKNPKRMKKIMDSNNLINNYSKRLRTNSKKLRSGEEQLDDLGDETNVELGNVKDFAMGNEGYHKKSWESWLEKNEKWDKNETNDNLGIGSSKKLSRKKWTIEDWNKEHEHDPDLKMDKDNRAAFDEWVNTNNSNFKTEAHNIPRTRVGSHQSNPVTDEKGRGQDTKIGIQNRYLHSDGASDFGKHLQTDADEDNKKPKNMTGDIKSHLDRLVSTDASEQGHYEKLGTISPKNAEKWKSWLEKNNAIETSHKDGEKKVEWDGKFSSSTIEDEVKNEDEKSESEEESLEELTDGDLVEIEKLKSWESWLEKDALTNRWIETIRKKPTHNSMEDSQSFTRQQTGARYDQDNANKRTAPNSKWDKLGDLGKLTYKEIMDDKGNPTGKYVKNQNAGGSKSNALARGNKERQRKASTKILTPPTGEAPTGVGKSWEAWLTKYEETLEDKKLALKLDEARAVTGKKVAPQKVKPETGEDAKMGEYSTITAEKFKSWTTWLDKMQGAGDARFGNQHLTGLDQKPVNNEEDEANILPEKEEKTDDKEEKQEKTDNKPYKALGGE